MGKSALSIGGRTFTSRLFLGTGKFASGDALREAVVASGSQLVTVAFKRVEREGRVDPILDRIAGAC